MAAIDALTGTCLTIGREIGSILARMPWNHSAIGGTAAALLAAGGAACTTGGDSVDGAVVAAAPATLVDLRVLPVPAPPSLSADRSARIVADVFGASYSGTPVAVNSLAHGSFTTASTPQTAYVLQRGGPRAAHPDTSGTVVLALYTGDDLYGRFNLHDGNFIASTPDVDADGVNEILLRDDAYHMGTVVTSLALISLAGADQQRIWRFDRARVDTCGQTRTPPTIEAVVVTYRLADSDRWPVFDVARHQVPCALPK